MANKKKNSAAPAGIRGGRFDAKPAEIMEEINASIDFDQRLYAQDIAGSKAHARMLADTGIISKDDANAIIQGLDTIQGEIESGDFAFSRELEDIHMNVEHRLAELIGDAAGRLHTAAPGTIRWPPTSDCGSATPWMAWTRA